tara:strand:+ start:933 stop:1430 length:498 start_codon:yes stop_codon:yes gene_type:complete
MSLFAEQEMDACFMEMERLQMKMKELQETKKIKQMEEANISNNSDSNLMVLQDWLNAYNLNLEMNALADKAYNKYQALSGRGEELVSKDEKTRIIENYNKYCNTTLCNNRAKPQLLRPIESFDNHVFMNEYIEASHNLFQIQQSRIEELESKLNAFVDGRSFVDL